MSCRKPTHSISITDKLSGRSITKRVHCDGFEESVAWGWRLAEEFRNFVRWNLEELDLEIKVKILNPENWFNRVKVDKTDYEQVVPLQEAQIVSLKRKIADLEEELVNARRA